MLDMVIILLSNLAIQTYCLRYTQQGKAGLTMRNIQVSQLSIRVNPGVSQGAAL